MNCQNITITNASAGDLRDILDRLSQVQLPHDEFFALQARSCSSESHSICSSA
jgi:hypothetical protein